VVLGVVTLVCVVLTRLDTQVRTPVGARGVGRGAFPVVEVAGLGSAGAGFAKLTAAMQARGVTVLDFDAGTPGVQPLVYRPESGQRIPALAVDVVQPAIRQALIRAGLDPMTQRVDVVAHSMGGLLVRYLVEHPVAGWARQVDDLVMVATPNHGSTVIAWETGINGNPMGGLGQDMKPGGPFLDALGYREPPGEVYTTIGGDPWLFRWLRHGSHGFDDQVPTESAFLGGSATDSFGHFHGRLLRSDDVVSLIARTLVAHQRR
jgi:pimeloyl-ACP methyl ester carboxylesterase